MFYFHPRSKELHIIVNGLFQLMFVEGIPGSDPQYSFANEFQPNKILNVLQID